MNSAKVHMYTTQWCGYCAAARDLLKSKGIDFEDIDVGMDAKLRKQMIELSGGTSVPQIFIDDKAIGGYDDMAALEASGKLDQLLSSAAG
jgi:glutaredoxin 3